MNNEDKIKDFQAWLVKMTEEFSEFTKPVSEAEFKEGDWLEFSDTDSFSTSMLSKFESVTIILPTFFGEKHSTSYRASNKLYYKYARRPYDRTIPHDGGPVPEWIKGKRTTLWYNSGRVQSTCVTEKHPFNHVKEYRVHKEEG